MDGRDRGKKRGREQWEEIGGKDKGEVNVSVDVMMPRGHR